MIFSLLSDYSPAVRPVYDDRSTAMLVMVIAICFLVVLCFVFLCVLLGKRHSNKHSENDSSIQANDGQVTESEKQVISEYRKLDSAGKELVNSTIQTLNSKVNKD